MSMLNDLKIERKLMAAFAVPMTLWPSSIATS